MTPREFTKWVYPEALRASDISAIFTTAQGALESGWGKSVIGNNLFGITKGSTWSGKLQLVRTTEYFRIPNKKFTPPEHVYSVTPVGGGLYKYDVDRLFRDYDSLADCLRDHQIILQKTHFADAWPYRRDPFEFVIRLQDAVGLKYATSPEYVNSMMNVIAMIRRIVKEERL